MFERFTEKAIKVIMLAQEEARRLGHNFVGTEQILLGLIGEGTAIAAKTLKSMGVNLKDARVEVEKIIGRGSGFVAVEIPFTPRAKRVLELSWDEAKQLGVNYIGTEHLLLGLVREGDGVAIQVLKNLQVDLSTIRRHAIRLIGELTGAASPTEAAGDPNRAGLSYQVAYGTDLTAKARLNLLDPVAGRELEIERTLCILGQQCNGNALLLGEKGVGKSAIVRGLALRLAAGDLQSSMQGLKLISLDIPNILAQSNALKILSEILLATQKNKIVFVIDDLDVILNLHFSDSIVMDALHGLNWFLKHNKMKCVGMANFSNIRPVFSDPPSILQNFQPIIVSPSTTELTNDILQCLRGKLELHHKVVISERAIAHAQLLSGKIGSRLLPNAALLVLDEACSLARLRAANSKTRGIRQIEDDMKDLLKGTGTDTEESLNKLELELNEATQHITVTAEDVEEVMRAQIQNLIPMDASESAKRSNSN